MTSSEAQQIARRLIQGYIGPDHKLKTFFGALVSGTRGGS